MSTSSSSSSPASLPLSEQSLEVRTVIRPEPTTWQLPAWVAEWPAWLRQSCLAWLEHRWWQWKPSRRQYHVNVHLRRLRLFWRWQLARRPVAGWQDLTVTDVIAYLSAEQQRGLAARSLVSILDSVYAILRYLQEEQLLTAIPPRPKITLPDPLPRHLHPEELLALETYVQEYAGQTDHLPWLTVALYYVLAHCGLRICELLDLQVQDLDLAHRRLVVRQGKGQRDRVVYLTDTAARALSFYLETVPQAPGDLVFSLNEAPLTYSQAWSRVRQLGGAAGILGLSPQRLRHTFATTLLNNGLTLEALRQLMGHNHLNTTLIYARLADSTVENQYQAAMAFVNNR